jgi:hypothetical protein
MASHIDPAGNICKNVIKITVMVLFINFYILTEIFLQHFFFKYHFLIINM